MPDCQMCWNDWPSLTATPFPAVSPEVQICRNCARSQKQTVAFVKAKGFALVTVSNVTGEIVSKFDPGAGPGPQAGSETLAPESKREEEPPDPPAKQARTKH